MMDDALLWDVRAFVYARFAEAARPPTVAETAAHFGLSAVRAVAVYRELHARHALYVDLDTTTIRMANPFSAVPTPFRVHAGGRDYWANCAWDALGIPAALHQDATIAATWADSGEPATITVVDGRVTERDAVVHFPLPFRRWYDDQVFT